MPEEPLLYISTPTYHLVQKPISEESTPINEESTSIYERPAPDVIRNELIARQLHFFARPVKQARPLLIVLTSGERFIGTLLNVQGKQVKINCYEQIRLIDGNEIEAIYITKS